MRPATALRPALVLALLALGAGVALANTERASVGPGGAQGDALSLNPDISADGALVTFAADATNLVPGDTNGAQDIFVRNRATGTTERVSINNLGAQAGANSFNPVLSADGRFVAWVSQAGNLVQGDSNGARDVFVRDRVAGTTERVSLNPIGNQGNAASGPVSIDADGSTVAFASDATNLAIGDANGQSDVFVRDRTGATTERVSVGPGGVEGNGPSGDPSISDDGRFVAFVSGASNLVASDTNGAADVFVRDRQAGVTERVSVGDGGAQVKVLSAVPEISGDGQVVAFSSGAGNLVEDDTNKRSDVFVHDRGSDVTELVSVGLEGAPAKGNSLTPAISDDGRYVSFESGAKNLVVEDTNKRADIFVRDRTANTTERVSLTRSGAQAKGRSQNPAISADGRFTVFQSVASNLVDGDTNTVADVFVRERPPPVIGEKVSVLPVEGEVLVAIPSTSGNARASATKVPGLKGLSFVPLTRVRSIPVGSFFDTRDGSVSLSSAKNSKGATQSGTFSAGVFQVRQSKRNKGLTTLALKGASFSSCRSSARGKASSASSAVAFAARKRLSRRARRRLGGRARGRFRTRGRHSAATVRGTVWITADRCDGTLTKVKRGKVKVRDFRRRRTIVLTKGKSYLASPRR